MGYMVALLSAALLTNCANAAEPAPNVDQTIKRGLEFLKRDALAWKKEHQCASCHHAALVVCALQEAKQSGYAVDEQVLADLTKWLTEAGDGKTSLPRPESAPNALNEKAVSYAFALRTNPQPDENVRNGMQRLLSTVKADQTADGSWVSWPETRPPIFGKSDERATLLAVLCLLPEAANGDQSAIAARDRALEWLSSHETNGESQSIVLRLIVSRRLDRPAAEWEPLVKRIRETQRADGGWSQTTEMTSDAWATGQSLYALAGAAVPRDDSAIQRAAEFLTKSQRDDGSWPMTSRPTKPGGEGSKSLVPITAAGSAWAVMGLVRIERSESLEDVNSAPKP